MVIIIVIIIIIIVIIPRQDAYMHYLFGVTEEGFWGAIDTRDVRGPRGPRLAGRMLMQGEGAPIRAVMM